MGNRWIVLIDKTPRGPLTEGEIRALLAQGLIRTNDVAYKITEAGSGGKAEWKFLWQFDEFDRRRGVEQAKFPVLERRTPKAEGEVEEEKQAILPQEISAIQPEDLMYHSTTVKADSDKVSSLHIDPLPDDLSKFPPATSFNWKWMAGAVPLLFVVLYFLGTSKKVRSNNNDGKNQAKNQVVEDENIPTRDVTSSPAQSAKNVQLPIDRTNHTPPPAQHKVEAKALPKAPEERGEVSYEEYRKKQDEQLDRERQEEENEVKKADAAADEEDEDMPKSKKKKGGKKRKAASEDSEDEKDPLLEDDAPPPDGE